MGVGTSRAVRIFKTYGADAVQVISDNPYRLARDIRGIGFKSADQIAMRLGIAKTAMIRARAGISYALAEAMDEGHCGLPAEKLQALAAELLEIPAEVVDAVAGRACVFLAGLYRAEQGIAERLRRLLDGRARPGRRSTRSRRSPGWEKVGIILTESQWKAPLPYSSRSFSASSSFRRLIWSSLSPPTPGASGSR
jgi:exodeoxyribonuclease V alpha subunit